MIRSNKKIFQFKADLNKIAEVGWQEVKTTAYLKKQIPLKPLIEGFAGKTGLLYKLGQGKEAILLRADIDGLKTNSGVKHICGHSSHMAGLLGAFLDNVNKASILSKNNKSIYFLFQPAEETFPSGAQAFVKEAKSILPQIKYAFATHVRPKMALGEAGLKKGPVWARCDYLEIEVFGKMVHVKDSPKGIDALEGAANIILLFKKLQKKFLKSARINIGVIQGGLQPNAVADYAILKADIRTKEKGLFETIKILLEKGFVSIQKSTGTTIKIHYFDSIPPVINDADLSAKIYRHLQKNSDFKLINDLSLFSFGSEDFSYIAEKIPSIGVLIGTGDTYNIHEENCTISDEGTLNIYKYFSKIIDWWLKS